jgi:hypothetical protein
MMNIANKSPQSGFLLSSTVRGRPTQATKSADRFRLQSSPLKAPVLVTERLISGLTLYFKSKSNS